MLTLTRQEPQSPAKAKQKRKRELKSTTKEILMSHRDM